MNEVVIQICEQLKREAQAVIDYAKSSAEVIKSGAENSVEAVSMFENLAADSVGHCQKLVIALSDCYFQKSDKKEETDE